MANASDTEEVEQQQRLLTKCRLCDKRFNRNSDFEIHMVDQHDAKKDFECDLCGKTFLLQWRLKKHGFIQTQKAKMSRYFVKNQLCPFNLVGCKF